MPDILRFTAPINLQAAADTSKPVKISIRAYAGGQMVVGGYGPVAIDITGLDISRAVPLLAEHQSDIAGLLGTGTATVVNGRELHVAGILSRANALTQTIIAMHKDGVQFSASIGVQPEATENVAEGKSIVVNKQTIKAGRGGLTLVRRGVLRETSIVAVAADADSAVAIAASAKGTKRMSDELNNTSEPTAFDTIQAAWNGASFHSPAIRDEVDATRLQAIAGRIGVADFKQELLAQQLRDERLHAVRSERPAAPTIHGSSRDAGKPADMLQASLLCHLGAESVAVKAFGGQVTQQARDLRHGSLVEILQAAWRAEGREAPQNRQELIKASFSTAAISNIVSGTQNKILLDQWTRLPLTCLQLCKQVSAANFKEGKAIRLVGRDAMLEELGPAGEIKHGNLQDSAATYQLATYARMYAVTRQDIVNDDLSALNELPRIIARGAGLKMESVFWTLVLANTGSFFSGGNGNLIDDVLNIAGLGVAVATMRSLVDADGEPILVAPRLLVVGPEQEATADALFASTNVTVAGTAAAVTTTPSASPFAGKYLPVCSPYITAAAYSGNSDTAWFLFADPNVGPAAFLVAFLNGQTLPTIEQADTDFNTLGIQYRGFLDFGFSQCDEEGAVMSSGDAV
jgi:hypothetical protein